MRPAETPDALEFLPQGPVRRIARRETERADDRVRAVLIAGSHARGEALAGSDLDLYLILADGEPAGWEAGWEEGVFVERAGWDEATARRKIAANPLAWATFREGRVLRDDGVMATLLEAVEAAALAWQPDPAEIAGCAHWLRSAIVKISAALAVGEEERAQWAASTSTYELARGIRLANGQPPLAAGQAWTALGDLPARPSLETLREILLGESPQTRCEAFLTAARFAVERLESTTPRP